MGPYYTPPPQMDGICPCLGTNDKGRAPIVRLPLARSALG